MSDPISLATEVLRELYPVPQHSKEVFPEVTITCIFSPPIVLCLADKITQLVSIL